MIRIVLLAALAAGLLAGVAATLIQSHKVVPLILAAETYETAAPGADASAAHDHAAGAPSHAHDAEAWAPEDGVERLAFTLLSNVLTGVAFALILGAAIMFSNRAVTLQSGLLWGAAGFFAFSLAPSLGLPPELPGMPAADLAARQVWWGATVLASAGGLALLAFGGPVWAKIAGVAVIVAPHVIGAPHVEGPASAVPATLAAEFAVASVVAAGLFWLVLGSSLGGLLQRLTRPA